MEVCTIVIQVTIAINHANLCDSRTEGLVVKNKLENETLACKGDTLPALLVWFLHNLTGLSNSKNDFCFFLSAITPYIEALTHC
jgi:hypothetical protein